MNTQNVWHDKSVKGSVKSMAVISNVQVNKRVTKTASQQQTNTRTQAHTYTMPKVFNAFCHWSQQNVNEKLGTLYVFAFTLSHSYTLFRTLNNFRWLKIVVTVVQIMNCEQKKIHFHWTLCHSFSFSLTLEGDRLRCVSLSLFNYISARFIFMCCKQNTEASTTGQMPIEYVCAL